MIVAGIDPSLTNTGIAILTDGHILDRTHLMTEGWPGHSAASDLDRHDRVSKLRTRIAKRLQPHQIDLLVMEQPAYSQNTGSACDRHMLWGFLLNLVRQRKYRYAGVSPSGRASFATGKLIDSKPLVVAEASTWHPTHRGAFERNDNIADAVVLATMGALWAGDPVPFEPKERHHKRIEAVAWPT